MDLNVIFIHIYKIKCDFSFMYTLDSDQLGLISISITLYFCHFFMVRTFKFLPSNYFEVYSASWLMGFTLLWYRTPGPFPPIE